MKSSGIFLVLFLFVGMVACDAVQTTEDPTGEIEKKWRAFEQAWNSLDAASCASFYATDGVNIPPDLEVRRGREDIRSFYEWLFSMHSGADYRHATISVSSNGNLAVEEGSFTVDWVTNDGVEWQYNARSLTHWERTGDQGWMIKTIAFNRAPEIE